jgi:hypothetical protein
MLHAGPLVVALLAQATDAPLLRLEAPAYRGWIFPDRPGVRLRPDDESTAPRRFEAAFVSPVDRKTRGGQVAGAIELDTGDLEPGDWTLEVALDGGAPQSFRLRKLSAQEARGVAAYVDDRGRLVWRGKPFFPRGWYSDGDIDRLRRLAAGPFNCVLDYGLTARPLEATRQYLDEAARLGIAVILCVNDVYPSAKHRQELGPWRGNDGILEGVVTAFRDHPATLAWYTNDELDFALAPEIRGYHERIARLDPGHPQLMAHFKRGGWRAFQEAADLLAVDNYPIPKREPLELAEALDLARAEITVPRPIWAIVQAFGWYQHRKPDEPVVPGDQATERARLPTPAEWEAGRPPTLDELRAMTYLSLVHGADGLLYWCLYNLDYLPDREERWRDAVSVVQEARHLEAALLAPSRQGIRWSDSRIHALEARAGEERWIIAVNASRDPVRARCTPGSPFHGAEVLFERRQATVVDGALVDFFPPLGRHVYRWR